MIVLWGKAVFIVVCRGGDLLVCQRVDEFRVLDTQMLGLQQGHM